MAYFLSPVFNEQTLNDDGDLASGWQLEYYIAGGSTHAILYKDSAGAAQHAWPIILNARGEPPFPIWIAEGVLIDFVLKDADGTTKRTIEDVVGVPDTSDITPDEWQLSGSTPTYINATQFTVPGDQTGVFHVNRRVQSVNTGGTIYSRISASAFTTLTTVTLVNDSGVLDSGLSAVSYGLLSAANPSIPLQLGGRPAFMDPTDKSKLLQLDLAGLTSGTTRTLTIPNKNITIAGLDDIAPNLAYIIVGLRLVNNGTTSMDIGVGQCADLSNLYLLRNLATFTKTQAAWTAGTGNGGKLSAAAMANETWYYFYAMRKDSDGTIDFGFDVSPTAPIAQTGYATTSYRLIGGRKTAVGATTWASIIQHGDENYWGTPPVLDSSSVASTANRTLITVNCPAYKTKWYGYLSLVCQAAADGGIILTDPDCADVAPSIASSPLASLGIQTQTGAIVTSVVGSVSCWTNATPAIGVRGIAAQNKEVQTIGWWDPRGRPI